MVIVIIYIFHFIQHFQYDTGIATRDIYPLCLHSVTAAENKSDVILLS